MSLNKASIVLHAAMEIKDEDNLTAVLKKVERCFMETALFQARNNVTYAAKLLGINRTTMVEKIKRHIDKTKVTTE